MEEKSIFEHSDRQHNMQQTLPNATAVLVLGILSIVICFLGLVLAIIALVLANKDLRMYNASPEVYSPSSYNNLKAGRTCAIIGLILNVLIVIGYAIIIAFAISTGWNTWH